MTCGIYYIRNTKNGKVYVGSSQNIEKRWERHVRDLKSGNHHNIYLQRAWNKYGEQSFELAVVKTCYKKTLIRREQKVLDELFSTGQLYNISPCASGGDILSSHPNRDDIVRRIVSRSREFVDSLSEQERKDKWAKYGKDNPNYGNTWSLEQRNAASERMKKRFRSPEERKKISEARKKYFSNPEKRKKTSEARKKYFSDPENRAKMSEARKKISEARKKYFSNPENRAKMSAFAKTRRGKKNPFYGKSHTKEFKEKMRSSRVGIYIGNQEKKVSIDGVEYKSVSYAARCIGVCPATVVYRIKSKNSKFSNYYYIGN